MTPVDYRYALEARRGVWGQEDRRPGLGCGFSQTPKRPCDRHGGRDRCYLAVGAIPLTVIHTPARSKISA